MTNLIENKLEEKKVIWVFIDSSQMDVETTQDQSQLLYVRMRSRSIHLAAEANGKRGSSVLKVCQFKYLLRVLVSG